MKNINFILLTCFYCLLISCISSCVSGADGGNNQQNNTTPILDPDKAKYAENILDFGNVQLKQYLAQSTNEDTYIQIDANTTVKIEKNDAPNPRNNFSIYLNKNSAKGLNPDKYQNLSYDIHMKAISSSSQDVTNEILNDSICRINYKDGACTVRFKAMYKPGIYTLKFSYQGIDVNKQIILYVASRQVWFFDSTKDQLHTLGPVYNMSLHFQSNLPEEAVSIPLTNDYNTFNIIKVGDRSGDKLQNPVCEFAATNDSLPRVCDISYKLIAGGSNHAVISAHTTQALRVFDLAGGDYKPGMCVLDGLELLQMPNEGPNKSQEQSPLAPVIALATEDADKNSVTFLAYYCVVNNSSKAENQFKLDIDKIAPVGKNINIDVFNVLIGDNKDNLTTFDINQPTTIGNGQYKVIKLQYNQDKYNKEQLKMFGSANFQFIVTDGLQHVLTAGFELDNPSSQSYLRINEIANNITNPDYDINGDTTAKSISSHSTDAGALYIQANNLQHSNGQKYTLTMNTCFNVNELEAQGIILANKKYDANDSTCLISYNFTPAGGRETTFNINEANILISYFNEDGKEIILPRGQKPNDNNGELKLLDLKNASTPTLINIKATTVYPDMNAKITIKFYATQINGGSSSTQAIALKPGQLDISLIAQQYLVSPDVKPDDPKKLVAFHDVVNTNIKNDTEHTDKFFVRIKPGGNAQTKSHALYLKIVSSSNPDIVIKATHMKKQENIDRNNIIMQMADNICDEDGCSSDDVVQLSTINGIECTVSAHIPSGTDNIIEDAAACNFEIISYNQKDADNVVLGLFDKQGNNAKLISNQQIYIKYIGSGNDINMGFDRYGPNIVLDGTTKKGVIFPVNTVIPVVKVGNDWADNIFTANAFFNSRYNSYVKDNKLQIVNFPGKLAYNMVDVSNTDDFAIGEFALWLTVGAKTTKVGTMAGKNINCDSSDYKGKAVCKDLTKLMCIVPNSLIQIPRVSDSGEEERIDHYTFIDTGKNSFKIKHSKQKAIPYLKPRRLGNLGICSDGRKGIMLFHVCPNDDDFYYSIASRVDNTYNVFWDTMDAEYMGIKTSIDNDIICNGYAIDGTDKIEQKFRLVQSPEATVNNPICISGIDLTKYNKLATSFANDWPWEWIPYQDKYAPCQENPPSA